MIGSLLVGSINPQGGGLVYRGHVGTGWSQRQLAELRQVLDPLASTHVPFSGRVPAEYLRDAHWVRPELVIEVAYRALTVAGRLRHPSFRAMVPGHDPNILEDLTCGNC